MDNEREDDNEINLTVVQRVSSIDSLDQTDGENLRFISGYHKWINKNEKHRVDKLIDNHHQQIDIIINDEENSIQQQQQQSSSIRNKYSNEEDHDNTLNPMDITLNHSDIQLQIHNEKFSSDFDQIHLFKNHPNLRADDMEMDNDENHSGKPNGYSQYRNNNNNNESYRKNGSSNNNENGANANRNNNNSRRSNDGSDENDDDDHDDDNHDHHNEDDDDNDDESDESLARRLGFLPLNSETINNINRLRTLANKTLFDRRDIEILQTLIDELIQIQHLETYSKHQLKEIIHYLKLYRPLKTKARALIFLQERIPRRAVKYNVIATNHDNHKNVFNIWRERERRARLDSKDSLEDDGQNLSGQQLRDVTEINHPTPPIILSVNNSIQNGTTSKVKQMAKDIDTRSTSSRSEINLRTGERFSDHAYIPRSSSPTYPGLVSVAVYDVKTSNNNHNNHHQNGVPSDDRLHYKPNLNLSSSLSPSISESNHVQKMIDRLESSLSSTSSDIKTKDKKNSIKKSLHDERSDGSTSLTSSPPIKRLATRDSNKNIYENHNDLHKDNFIQNNDSTNEIKVQVNNVQRTASGTTMEEYVTTLHPGTETSVSMVRDIRACLYEDDTSLSRTDVENIPIKVDVETLYILEQKSDGKSLSPMVNIFIPDYEYKHSKDRQDFSIQTTIPITPIKPPHRPIGTQVDHVIEQHTVSAQTTDSLHRPPKERQRLPTPPLPPPPSITSHHDDETNHATTTYTTTTRYEIKRRHSSHHTSDDDDDGAAIVFIDDNKTKDSVYGDNFQLKPEDRHSTKDEHLPTVSEQPFSFGQVTSRIRIDRLRDLNGHVVRRYIQSNDLNNNHTDDEYRSSEIYEIHTRGACKCLVISSEEKTQYGSQTRFENQLERIERTYTDDELKSTELHVIVTTSDKGYQLVRRDYGLKKFHHHNNDEQKENEHNHEKSQQPTITVHYYTKDGQRMRTEYKRYLENLPLVIRSEIEYELNHYGSSHLIILAVANSERRQINTSLKKELVDEIVSRSRGRLLANSPELEQEITRQLSEPTNLLHLVDYTSRDDYNQTNSNDLRRVSRIDVTTSLRLVQRYRTIIHRLCQLYRSHLRLTHHAEQQRYLILVANNEYYLLDLASQKSSASPNISDIRQRQHDIFKREVNNVIQEPFDFVKYRQDIEQEQKRLLEQRYKQKQESKKHHHHENQPPPPPPTGHPSEVEFYLGSQRRALIERQIHSMRQSIRPHEHAPPRYKHEPKRRSLSISYSGGQRYVRARIIHVKDFYDDIIQHNEQKERQAKEQELFVRVDDFINESAANSLRRSYSTDYLQEDGPRSRIRYIRIPGETIKIEEKTTYEYKGIMYADLPYSLRYWNILSILDHEVRQGRPLGSSFPQVMVNDPYRTVIPPLTQQEIRQTAQQILSPQYNVRSYTDQTLRWFLSRDNRTEIESAKYLQTLEQYRPQKQEQEQQPVSNKQYVTETVVRYEKMPDRFVPIKAIDKTSSLSSSKEFLPQRSPSIPRILHPPKLPLNSIPRSKSQPRPTYQPSPPIPLNQTLQQRLQLPPMNSPLSRHQSVHELHPTSTLSHPPSPSPSLHSLHPNHTQHRRPVAFNNRFPVPPPSCHQQTQNPLLTEIIDSQTGRRILTTSQEQLPTEVLGLLNKYNLQQL